MLQVTDNGANITLSGKASAKGNGMFWFATALLIGAVGVAMAMSILPERLAIGALAILIVGSFVFNKLRSKSLGAEATHIQAGILKVQQGRFVHNLLGKQVSVVIEASDSISINESQLIVTTSDGAVKCKVTGFDSPKEAEVMRAVLSGQKFGKRNANIKMQSK